jgi:hypothetical protein
MQIALLSEDVLTKQGRGIESLCQEIFSKNNSLR